MVELCKDFVQTVNVLNKLYRMYNGGRLNIRDIAKCLDKIKHIELLKSLVKDIEDDIRNVDQHVIYELRDKVCLDYYYNNFTTKQLEDFLDSYKKDTSDLLENNDSIDSLLNFSSYLFHNFNAIRLYKYKKIKNVDHGSIVSICFDLIHIDDDNCSKNKIKKILKTATERKLDFDEAYITEGSYLKVGEYGWIRIFSNISISSKDSILKNRMLLLKERMIEEVRKESDGDESHNVLTINRDGSTFVFEHKMYGRWTITKKAIVTSEVYDKILSLMV